MIPDRIKQQLVKDRRMTSITLRIPVDLVDSLKELASRKTLQQKVGGGDAALRAGRFPGIRYASSGLRLLRRDEAKFTFAPTQRLVQALKKRGVSAKVLDQALHDLAA